jgi:predicted RNA methylase
MAISCELSPIYSYRPTRGIAHYTTSLINRVSDCFWENRFMVETTGGVDANASDEVNAYGFVAYHTWFRIFDHLALQASDVVVDLGAGKGRVVCVAASYPVQRVVGVEIDPQLAAAGRSNALTMRGRHAPVDVRTLSATDFNYDDATVITLFHPFGSETMHRVLQLVEASLARRPRLLRIVYCNPVLSPQLAAKPWLELYECWTPRTWSRLKFPVHFYRSAHVGPRLWAA